MQKYFLNNNSDKLLLFFTGWGCDENQFTNLTTKSDLLLLYDYQNLNLEFNFSKYSNIQLLAYSAGVFVSTIVDKNIPKITQRIAISGNPYLFDEKLGLTKSLVQEFREINLDNYLAFRRKYMVETEEEFKRYNDLQSLRSLESCQNELTALENLYENNKKNISFYFDKAVIGENDIIFKVENQKGFYKDKIKLIPKSRHHIFFKFKTYEEIINY